MDQRNRVFIANFVGIVVLTLGMFGVDVDAETQTQIIAGLGAIGCVVNSALAVFTGANP